MKQFDTVIFDLGGVLIDWNPEYLYRSIFSSDREMKQFLATICTPAWNEEQDGGRTLREGTELLLAKHQRHENNIRAFYDRWEEMLKGPIEGTVDVLKEIKDAGSFRLYALTNWSAETFPVAKKKYEFLQWFEGILVSGEEKIRKPFIEIYQLLLSRFGIDPSSSIYIDDNERNLKTPRQLGITSILFASPGQLRADLRTLGVLA